MDALIDDMEYRWSCIQADLRKLPRDAVRVCEYKLDAGEDVDKRAAVADALEFLTGELQALEASTAIAESLDATGIHPPVVIGDLKKMAGLHLLHEHASSG